MSDGAGVHALAREVAAALGDGWTYAAPEVPEGERLPWFAEVRHPDGPGLHLSATSRAYDLPPDRVVVGGTWPRTARGETVAPHVPYGERAHSHRPEISVSVARGAGAVAREVERRLLPLYLPKWRECVERARRSDEYAAGVAALLDRLARVVGVRLRADGRNRRDRPGFTTHGEGPWVEVEPSGPGSATLKFHDLPPEAAERLLSASGIREGLQEEEGAEE